MNPRIGIEQAMDRAAFLGRLWTLFGPARPRQGGFEYFVRDTQTNLDFIAYAGPRGPCYGGDLEQRLALRPVLQAFEYLLDATPPAECSLEYAPEREFGTGTWTMGIRGGRSFDVPDARTGRVQQLARR